MRRIVFITEAFSYAWLPHRIANRISGIVTIDDCVRWNRCQTGQCVGVVSLMETWKEQKVQSK